MYIIGMEVVMNYTEPSKFVRKTWEEDVKAVRDAIAKFPAQFHLRGDQASIFRISETSSYVNDSGEVMLYSEILKDGKWLSYAKGTSAELLAAIIPIMEGR